MTTTRQRRPWAPAMTSVVAAVSAVSLVAGCGGSSSSTSSPASSAAGSSTTAAAAGAATSGASTGGAGTSAATAAAAATTKGGTLTLGVTQSAPTTFNPWGEGAGINGSLWLNGSLYDSLTRLDGNGKVLPGVATSWTVAGNVVTLQLRTGITFDDGTPLDAAAVKANFDYASAQPNGAECNQYITGVQTTVLSPTSVQLTLKAPVPGILQDLGQCAGFMVEPKALTNDAGLKTAPAGSGPYVLDTADTVIGQKYVFTKRPGYWDDASYPFAKVEEIVYASTTAADNAAKSGQVDFLQQVAPTDKASGLKIIATAPDEFRGFWITDTSGVLVPALKDVRVRQAMNYAIDRASIEKAFYGQYAVVAGSTPFNSNYAGYTAALATTYPYDIAKAKSLLAAAGYSSGITINALVDPGFQKLGQAMAGYMRSAGINLNLSVHSADFITQMFSGKWPLVLGNYTLNPAQLQTLQGIAGTNGFWNPRKNVHADVEALLTQIAAATPDAAKPLYATLATTLAQDALFVNPVIVATTMGYNDKKLKVIPTTGVPVPLIYNFSPA